ncbi:hypothetical protein BD324DRAFT_21530 [Kockovaella imperatae]|uniref:Uncharacterized protein n=1 Tax=Kockovaella imperatae TaxID=4999 RepID=A0A1Y1UUC8_9TREE|nr:hypothetical protein BD324DRAFT_21530 [Kockovaella imperatae]ORX40795.1 hypothetical protein BD324DRAFT_21530 [Kockovaella imperatae]
MTVKVIRIALLICDTPLPRVMKDHGDYLQIYRTWLLDSLATYSDQEIAQDTELILDGYNVVDHGQFPPRERLIAGARDAYDAVMLTGSSEYSALHCIYGRCIGFYSRPTLCRELLLNTSRIPFRTYRS